MKTNKRSNNIFLSITVVLAVGILTGCQYCEPLLMAALVSGTLYKGLTYSPFADPKHFNQKI